MKSPISTNFYPRCKSYEFKTYAVWDTESREFVDGTESTELEQVNGWALKLNQEEDEKQSKIN